MKEVVSLQYRASASDSWMSQRLSHKGNRITLSDKDSDMGTVYDSEAELHIRTADYGIPAMDLLLRMWHIDDTYTDIGTATNPVRVQKRVDGAMVTAVLKHESIAAPVQGSVLYIPFQVGSEQVFPGSSFISIHPDSPASSFAIDGVQGVYTKMLTADTTVMLEVYDAETFRFQGMTFGGCKYVNLSQIKAKGVVVAGLYNGKTAVRLLTPLTKIDLPREIDAQVLSIESLNEMQAISFAYVDDMSGKIINLPTFLTGDIERTLQSLIDAHYTGVKLGINNYRVGADTIDKLVYLIEQHGYTVAMAWETGNRTLSYLDPQVNDLAYVLGFEIKLRIIASPYITGMIDIVTHPGYTLRYDTEADTLSFITHKPDTIILVENIAQSSIAHTIKLETTVGSFILTVDGTVMLTLSYLDMQVSGAMQMSFGDVLVYALRVFGNPASERTYTLDPRGWLKEQRSTGTLNKYLTNSSDEPILVLPSFIQPW